MNGLRITVILLGGLGLFLFGMKILSESLQMATGDRLRSILWKVTNNRFLGILTGFLITGIIQSSSATTVMLVSFVNAGLINLLQSIGIILGANIGTTVTGWIVAILGFKIDIASFALPAIAIGFFIRFLKKEKLTYWGDVLLGFGILFLGLNIMNGAVKDLRGSVGVMDFMATYHATDICSTLVVVSIGTIVTMIVQSSSATMAMTMTLAVNGLIDFPTACALILGENIGTTITANIASIGASTPAKRSARIHMVFNVFGVIWVVALFHWFFLPLIDWIVPGNPFSTHIVTRSRVIAEHLAAFHTVFNVTNSLLFLPSVKLLATIAERLVPEKKKDLEASEFHLKYISTNLMSTPAININQARLEIKRMTGIALEMFDMVMNVFTNPESKLGDNILDIQKKENTIDLLEKEISTFLVKVSQHNVSVEQSHEISSMLHTVNELERIGDHCENLTKLIRRRYDSQLEFSERAIHEIHEIAEKVREFLLLLHDNISETLIDILSKSEIVENRIDELRKEFRREHIQRLNEGICDVDSGLIFIDMLTSFEKIGDHAFNVAEGISGKRIF
jgi:phosphate:Na+ symporter